jgi:hypothetical protein
MAFGIIFLIGMILIALNYTFFPMDALLLAGIILAGVGVAFSKIFREPS